MIRSAAIYQSAHDRTAVHRRQRKQAAALIAAFVILTLLDFWLLHLAFDPSHTIEKTWLFLALRNAGSAWTWAVAGLVLICIDRGFHRGVPTMLAPLAAGSIAELLKLLVGRARPVEDGLLIDGWYHFRPLLAGFNDGSNLGMPSSHAAVAFTGAFLLGALVLRFRPLLLVIAIGCGLSRIITGAHFPTDVFVGAVIGWTVARMFRGMATRIHAGDPVPSISP